MIGRLAAALARAGEAASAVLFAAVFAIFVFKIAMRYLAHDPLAWGDEVTVVLFIWIVFIANALVVEDRRQICFDLVYRHVSPPVQRALGLVRALLIGGLFAVSLPGSIGYIRFLWRERTPVLLWRLDWVYACFGLFMIAVILRLGAQALRLAGPRWRDAL